MKLKQFVAGALLLALLVMMLAGCGQQQLGNDSMAIVSGHSISAEAFQTRLKIFGLFSNQPAVTDQSKQQVLDQMVQDELLGTEAAKAGVTVTDAQVENEMARFFGALDKQYQTRDAVNKKLQDVGLTNDDIAAFLKEFLTSQGAVEKKKGEVQVTDDELRAYYDAKKDTLYTYKEDVVRAAHILVPLDQEAKAKEIAAKAKAGGDFAELARLYSVDPDSAQQGGELGYFTRSSMVKEFSDAAFSMAPGRTSDPVKSQYGWHIILVEDKQGPGVLPFDKAKEDVKVRVLREKQDKAYQDWISGLEKGAQIQKADLSAGTK